MYNATTIKAGLLGLIGWRQNLNSTGTQLKSMLTSDSGLWFNDVHPLCSFENLESIAKSFSRYTVADWDNSTAYVIGAFVTESSKTYRCILAHTNQAVTETAYWRETNLFTEWLRDFTESAIVETVQDWVTTKTNLKTATNLLERNELFIASGNTTNDLQTKTNKTVGLEIVPLKSKSIKVKISQIGLQFDTDQTITVRLKESGKMTDFKNVAVAYTATGGVQWFDVTDWELDGNKSYWICYDEDGISGNAVNGVKEYQFHAQGRQTFPSAKWFKATAFRNNVTLSGSSPLDLSDNEYLLDTNFGLNLRLSVQCDYTDLITEQKDLFKTAIWKKVGVKVLQILAYNPDARLNRNQSNIDFTQIQFEINGDSRGKKQGLLHDYQEALKAISFDSSGVDKVCLPCKRKGVEISSVW